MKAELLVGHSVEALEVPRTVLDLHQLGSQWRIPVGLSCWRLWLEVGGHPLAVLEEVALLLVVLCLEVVVLREQVQTRAFCLPSL